MMIRSSVHRTRSGREQQDDSQQLWAHHHAQLRDPHQVASFWSWASDIDSRLLACETSGPWWETIESLGVTLILSREYEHFALALSVVNKRPRISYFRMPHPSGIAYDPASESMYFACTRTPNMLYTFSPCSAIPRKGATSGDDMKCLLPTNAMFLPGSLYLHDLAIIRDRLYANAVGMNAVVELTGSNPTKPVWWPRSIDAKGASRFTTNYLQVNSIAPGTTLADSFYSASASAPSGRRPGHLNFPVDRRGVLFYGKTREVHTTGLTRPHSARMRDREVWVDNSGYGEFGRCISGCFEPIIKLPGWTRGLAFYNNIAFVGTSRVIPRYACYAPGIDVNASKCGLHAIDMKTGTLLCSILWPLGNQLFAIQPIRSEHAAGFPFLANSSPATEKAAMRQFSKGLLRT